MLILTASMLLWHLRVLPMAIAFPFLLLTKFWQPKTDGLKARSYPKMYSSMMRKASLLASLIPDCLESNWLVLPQI